MTHISKIALGTVQFGLNYGISNKDGQTSDTEILNILEVAKKHKIDTIDTAYAYGQSEQNLGKFDMDPWEVISKFPAIREGTSLTAVFNESLSHLNQNSLYGYISHSATVLLENPFLWEELQEIKSKNLVKKIGYSIYSPRELESLLQQDLIPDLIQIPYNILDRRFEPYLKELKAKNIEIHTRSAFLQGLLFIDPDNVSGYFEKIIPILKEFNGAYPQIEDKIGVLLNFCLGNLYLDKVVIGVNNKKQLENNIASISLEKSIAEINIDYKSIPEEILLPYNWPK